MKKAFCCLAVILITVLIAASITLAVACNFGTMAAIDCVKLTGNFWFALDILLNSLIIAE